MVRAFFFCTLQLAPFLPCSICFPSFALFPVQKEGMAWSLFFMPIWPFLPCRIHFSLCFPCSKHMKCRDPHAHFAFSFPCSGDEMAWYFCSFSLCFPCSKHMKCRDPHAHCVLSFPCSGEEMAWYFCLFCSFFSLFPVQQGHEKLWFSCALCFSFPCSGDEMAWYFCPFSLCFPCSKHMKCRDPHAHFAFSFPCSGDEMAWYFAHFLCVSRAASIWNAVILMRIVF